MQSVIQGIVKELFFAVSNRVITQNILLFSIEATVFPRYLIASLRSLLCAIILLGCLCAMPARAEQPPAQSSGDASQPSPGQLPPFDNDHPIDEAARRRQREMEKERNKERQQSLKKDTDRLLQLATELKQYVDKTNENMLSMDVIKKAEEVEKLAHQVREKMKGNY